MAHDLRLLREAVAPADIKPKRVLVCKHDLQQQTKCTRQALRQGLDC